METALFSVILSTLVRNLPVVAIFAIGIILVSIYSLNKYLKAVYVPVKLYEKDKMDKIEVIEHYKEEFNNKSIKTHEDLMQEIDKLNDSLNKYVLKDVFEHEISSIESKIDKLEGKIDEIPTRISESEDRIIDMFLKMFKKD